MGIDIKKTGKNTYYRKDGNKLGGRKEKREMLNISIKHFENDFEKRNASRYNTFHGIRGLNTLLSGGLSGGLKRGEMAVIGVCQDHHDDHHTSALHTIAMAAIERDSKICMIGLEDNHEEVLERANKFYDLKKCCFGKRPEIIMVNDIPYNHMDELDRPWIYNNDSEVVSLVSERYMHHVDDNHKYMYPHSILKENLNYNLDEVSIDAISAWKNDHDINFWYGEDKQYHKECNVTDGEDVPKPLDGVTLKPKYDSSLPLGVTSLEDLSNWAESSGFKFEYPESEILNIGRGFTKPVFTTDVSLEDLLAAIINLLPVDSYPSIISLENKKYVACIVDDNGDVISKESKEYTNATQAFSMLYTRLRLAKESKDVRS